jgi:hypothetical protein
MEFADIPTLEETLRTTKQPAKRAKLEAMIAGKKYLEGRGMKTRGWAARAPTKGKERHQLHAECGDKCFLNPEQEKFPICASPRTTGGKSKCEIDLGGLQSAYNRAKQYGYVEEAAKAKAILDKHKKYPKMSPSAMVAAKMDKSRKYEKDDYLMPRRVARRNVRRSVLLEDDHYGKHENHKNHHGNMNWKHEEYKVQNMVRDPHKDWDNDEGKDHRKDWDHEDRKNGKDQDDNERFNKDYTKKGDYSTIRLSPSMTRFGTMDKNPEEADCGCGN